MYTNNRILDLNSYINTLWNYFQTYNKSFNKDNIGQENNWLGILEKSDLIRTEGHDENLKLYLEEGRRWIKSKYGFSSHWSMHQYTKTLYDQFFELHPELKKYKL